MRVAEKGQPQWAPSAVRIGVPVTLVERLNQHKRPRKATPANSSISIKRKMIRIPCLCLEATTPIRGKKIEGVGGGAQEVIG